jgi:hypothetical protein
VLLGGDTEGRIVGGAIGYHAYDKPRSGRQTAEAYGYKPSQGTIVTIENVEVAPRTVEPGQVVDMKATYALLTPSEHE